MPNILIGYNGKFEPFSYEELLTPIAYATEQQEAYEKAYDDLGDAADKIGMSLDPNDPGSKDAWALYNNYNNQLNGARDQLLEKGFKDPNTRQNLRDIKKAYNNNMQRVNNAIATRNEKAKSILEEKAKNPEKEFSPLGTIDDYLHGKAPEVVSIDLKNIRERGEKLADAASSRFYSDGIEPLGNGMYRVRTKQGYDRMESLEAILKYVVDKDGNVMSPEEMKEGEEYRLAYPEIAYLYEQLYADPNVNRYLAAMPDKNSFKNAANMIDSAIREGFLRGLTLKASTSYHNEPRGSVTNVHIDNGNGLPTGEATGKTYDFEYNSDNYGYEYPDKTADNLEKYLKPYSIGKNSYDVPFNIRFFDKDGFPLMQGTFLKEGLANFEKAWNALPQNNGKISKTTKNHDLLKAKKEKELRTIYQEFYNDMKDVGGRINITPNSSGGYIKINKNDLQEVVNNLHRGHHMPKGTITRVPIDDKELEIALSTASKKNKNNDNYTYDIRKIEKINPTTGIATLGNQITKEQLYDEKGNISDVDVRLPNDKLYIMEDGVKVPALILHTSNGDYAIKAKYFSNETLDAVSNSYNANQNVINNTPVTVKNSKGESYTYPKSESAFINTMVANENRSAVINTMRFIEPGKYTNSVPFNPKPKESKNK